MQSSAAFPVLIRAFACAHDHGEAHAHAHPPAVVEGSQADVLAYLRVQITSPKHACTGSERFEGASRRIHS